MPVPFPLAEPSHPVYPAERIGSKSSFHGIQFAEHFIGNGSLFHGGQVVVFTFKADQLNMGDGGRGALGAVYEARPLDDTAPGKG